MTDLHTYTSTSGTRLSIRLREQDVLAHGSTRLFLGVDHSGMFIPTADLLAVIDAADPDAMRAYLRETVEREVAEADSPEDIDERVRPTPAAAERLALLETVRALYPGLNSKVHREVVEWIIGDKSVRIQDYNMAGEPIGPRTSQQLHESEED